MGMGYARRASEGAAARTTRHEWRTTEKWETRFGDRMQANCLAHGSRQVADNFPRNPVVCWRRCATFIIMTHRRKKRLCRRNSGYLSIRSKAGC